MDHVDERCRRCLSLFVCHKNNMMIVIYRISGSLSLFEPLADFVQR